MDLARIRTPEYALFYCRAGQGLDICLGGDYVVEFDYGVDYAELIEFGDLKRKKKDLRIPGFRVVRLLNNQERKDIECNLEEADQIRREFTDTLNSRNMRAKIVHVRLSLDKRRIFIRYYARSPLSLQMYTKALEKKYRANINLWQVGVRDETRLTGCIGHCGREACCCSWMKHDSFVNLKMAKNQDIPLNPASLNGTCNRLKCCFKYEDHVYEEAGAKLPQVGTFVICAEQDNFEGVIINRDILRGRLVLRSRKGKFLTVEAGKVKIKDEG